MEVLSVTDSGRRRRWTVEEKVRIVEESFALRAVASTARRHEIARALLTRWRAEYRAGALGGDRGPSFTRLAVMTEPVSASASVPAASAVEARVEIVLENGRRVLVPASIDRDALARLLPVLDRA